jgi:hypothetical protein
MAPRLHPARLNECAQLEGVPIFGPNREPLGSIAKIFIDSDSSTVSYVLAKFDRIGFDVGVFSNSLAGLEVQSAVSGYQTHLTKGQLLDAPEYSASSDFDIIWLEVEAAIYEYYGRCH